MPRGQPAQGPWPGPSAEKGAEREREGTGGGKRKLREGRMSSLDAPGFKFPLPPQNQERSNSPRTGAVAPKTLGETLAAIRGKPVQQFGGGSPPDRARGTGRGRNAPPGRTRCSGHPERIGPIHQVGAVVRIAERRDIGSGAIREMPRAQWPWQKGGWRADPGQTGRERGLSLLLDSLASTGIGAVHFSYVIG